MWLFKRKKVNRAPESAGPRCTFCSSTRTRAIYGPGDEESQVKAWRGQRYLTLRCLDCGREFYVDAPEGGLPETMSESSETVDDEAALRAAEDELKKELEDKDDRMFPG